MITGHDRTFFGRMSVLSPLKRIARWEVKSWPAWSILAARVIFLAVIFVGLSFASAIAPTISPAMAQDVPEELLRRLQEQNQNRAQELRSPVDRARAGGPARPTDPFGQIVTEPAEPSRIELDYRERLDSDDLEIEQYGYALFAATGREERSPVGRVPESYILGIGDEIVVTFIGSTDRSVITQIDSEGRVVLPELRPVPAAGRRFGEFRDALKAQVAASLLGTEVYVSVGSMRQVGVLVLGEVSRPGLHNLTTMSSLLDALTLAGIKKSGSLRAIRIETPDGSRQLDIYDLLHTGAGADLQIVDGMRIIVPLIGPTVAVTGQVIRPAIYELSPASGSITGETLLALAGGTLRPRGNSFVVNAFEIDGRQSLKPLENLGGELLSGSILIVNRMKNLLSGKVTLAGHVGVAGARSLEAAPTLSALIGGADGLGRAPYLLFGILETKDSATQARLLKAVDLEKIIAGVEDVLLRDEDILYVLSATDVDFLSGSAVRNAVLTGEAPSDACPALTAFVGRLSDTDRSRYAAVVRGVFVTSEAALKAANANAEAEERRADAIATGEGLSGQEGVLTLEETAEASGARGCSALFDENEQLLAFALEHVVSLTGAVRRPGVYPLAVTSALSSVVAVAGGFVGNADIGNIEVITFSDMAVGGPINAGRRYVDAREVSLNRVDILPGSSIRFNANISDQEPGSVLLTGEFKRPGVYSITRGETMGQLIERAGGLTEFAYPYGAQMTRVSVKREQEEGFRRAARELNSALASAVLRRENVSADAIVAAQGLSDSLASVEAPGRIVVEADPAVLRTRPELDIVLEPGDALNMPKRPNFVVVAGDVLNPGALQFIAGKDVDDYLAESGGLQSSADSKRVFLVYPNGVAEPVRISRWAFSSVQVPPGTTVVVPKDTSLPTLGLVRDISSIFSQLALAAASIAVISR